MAKSSNKMATILNLILVLSLVPMISITESRQLGIYGAEEGDTCELVIHKFQLGADFFLSINPNLNCNNFFVAAIAPSSKPPPLSKLSGSSPSSSSQHNSGSVRSRPNFGQISKKSLGPLTPQLQLTSLITSEPLGLGPLSSWARRSSGQLEHTGSMSKVLYGSLVTTLSEEVQVEFQVSKMAIWLFMVVVVAMGLLVGGFLMVAVKKWMMLVAVKLFLVSVLVVVVWNCVWEKKGLLEFVMRYPDAELRGAVDGQYVKGSLEELSDLKKKIQESHGIPFDQQKILQHRLQGETMYLEDDSFPLIDLVSIPNCFLCVTSVTPIAAARGGEEEKDETFEKDW
ncbi:hypothetical protein C1H46_022067 [Malus baccata]|uniref:LysM domain-containing protein n=1 Tax=Malus baccata TaxID=106549 RepID=A0A540M102_MALBA|nr:hypothetical protein C1H46_022067 [Malus baccata]